MSDMTREEIEKSLELVEQRAATREATLGGKIDRILDQMAALSKDVGAFRAEVREEVKAENSMTRWSIWGLGGVMIAVVLGLIGFLIANQGTMTTASGASTIKGPATAADLLAERNAKYPQAAGLAKGGKVKC